MMGSLRMLLCVSVVEAQTLGWRLSAPGTNCVDTCSALSASATCRIGRAKSLDKEEEMRSVFTKIRNVYGDTAAPGADECTGNVSAGVPGLPHVSSWQPGGACGTIVTTSNQQLGGVTCASPFQNSIPGSKRVICCCIDSTITGATAEQSICPFTASDCVAPNKKWESGLQICMTPTDPCPAAYYKNVSTTATWPANNILCAACPALTTSPIGSTAITACVCKTGYWSPTGQFPCTKCDGSGAVSGSAPSGLISDCVASVTRWYWGGGLSESCDEVCNAVKGSLLSCQAPRMSAVSSCDRMKVVNKALKEEAGRVIKASKATECCCQNLAGSSAPERTDHELSGQTPFMQYSSSLAGVASTCEAKASSRLCCCTAIGEDPTTLCAVDSNDCGLDFTWETANKRCKFSDVTHCPANYYSDIAATGVPTCTKCKGMQTSPAGSSAESACGCGIGFYYDESSLVCVVCPAWGTTLLHNATKCTPKPGVQLLSGWTTAKRRGGLSCDDVCGSHPRSGLSCRVARMRAVTSKESFHVAMEAIVGGAGAAIKLAGGGQGGPAAAHPSFTSIPSTYRYDGSASTCAWKETVHPESSWTPVRKDLFRICCCAAPGDNANSMCALSALDCAPGTIWSRPHCVPCAPGTHYASTPTPSCVPCAKGRFESGVGANASKCSGECPAGRFGNRDGGTAISDCDDCEKGAYSLAAASTACVPCTQGRFSSEQTEACVDCLAGKFAAFQHQSACSNCSASRFASTAGPRSSNAGCATCLFGRFSIDSGRTSECTLYGASNAMCPALVEGANLGPNVIVALRDSVLNVSTPAASGSSKFGDIAVLRCADGTTPQFGPNVVSCSVDGQWKPDPRITSNKPTQCLAQYCANAILPGASSALVITSGLGVEDGKSVLNLKAKQSPMQVTFQCDPAARMVVNETIKAFGFALGLHCNVNGSKKKALQWLDIDEELVDFTRIKCQCGQGHKQGSGATVAECVPCPDGTYAPPNKAQERAECRACPREGVNCNGGILVIQDDYWYDAERAASFGIGSTTNMYPCTMRDACLVNTSAVPMAMGCHENHTGVMCSRCFSRHVDCGRESKGEAQDASCAKPGYFSRDPEWMYFAPIARHCVRCPAGEDAFYSYIITVTLALGFCGALVLVVVQRLTSAWKRMKGKRRSDASGIARVFFNWIQMVSMLQSVKLQPPEEVTDAMETAEVANVSIEWFPVQCTLRLDFFSRVLIYMTMPIFAVMIPLAYVYVTNKCTPLMRKQLAKQRRKKRIGSKISKWNKFVFSIVSILSGDDLVKKAIAKKEKHTSTAWGGENEVESLRLEIDRLIDDLDVAEAELRKLKDGTGSGDARGEESEREEGAEARATGKGGAIAEKVNHTDSEVTLAPIPEELPPPNDLSRCESFIVTDRAFFEVVSHRALSLRKAAQRDAEKLDVVVQLGDVVVTEHIETPPWWWSGVGRCRFIKLTGPWGEGWLFDTLPDGTELLRELELDAVADPLADAVDAHYRDEVLHCFRSICAMSAQDAPERSVIPGSIARESIEHVLPAAWTQEQYDAFFVKYDEDGDGTIDFIEFVAMHVDLRAQWRFEGVWEEFQNLDSDIDGKLEAEELRSLVPLGSSDVELAQWMNRFDRGSKGFLTLSDFVAIDGAVQRDTLLLSVGTAFVLCTYFVYSRVTKALLSVFSMETIEGTKYLKFELGTEAMTVEHKLMMAVSAVYLAVFSVSVPLIGLWLMFQLRHDQNERRVSTMAGFLTDGYRSEVSWFWEFVVLARKLIILSVSLFVEEAFLQSLTAVVVLVLALSLQLYVRPFELSALNVLEIASLSSLLTTQLGGVLMWYKLLPGNMDNLELYQNAVVVVLLVTNGAVIVGFVSVTAWYFLKQKSKHIVQWLPCTLPLFAGLVRIEETLRWPNGTPLLMSERLTLREDWSFFESMQKKKLFGKGAAHSAWKKATKVATKVVGAMREFEDRYAYVDPSDAPGSEDDGGPDRRGEEVDGSTGRDISLQSAASFRRYAGADGEAADAPQRWSWGIGEHVEETEEESEEDGSAGRTFSPQVNPRRSIDVSIAEGLVVHSRINPLGGMFGGGGKEAASLPVVTAEL